MNTQVAPTQRRIIRRPRLTKLLDESPARIRLLIAPAGYGKTTLAQQWLGEPERRAVWYRGGPASADVAALAAGISEAVSEIVPGAGKRMRERVRAVGHPEEDVDVLADLFAEDIQTWSSDAWLAIDDYHFAMDSVASERFVDLLTHHTSLQILIASRRRPSWATARRILYGEIHEIDRRTLAMENGEAHAVLDRDEQWVAGLLQRASGWPAVIGLAALTDVDALPSNDLPDALYEYFAEEIFQAADSDTQLGLAQLALARVVDDEFAADLLGRSGGRKTLREGARLGVFHREPDGTYLVHPLLSQFLEMQLRLRAADSERSAAHVGDALLRRERWDEAFDVAERFGNLELTERVVEASLDRLLQEGRIATMSRWLERSTVAWARSPVIDLAEAEVAFRLGEHSRAEALAAQAAMHLGDDHALASRAYKRAGQSALMASREPQGLKYFERAHGLARTKIDMREALVGLYFAASELDQHAATKFLAELSALDDPSPEASLRVEVARLTQATREGGLREAVKRARLQLHLVPKATDPLAATALLHMFANALNLSAQYDEAYEVIQELISFAAKYRLEMPTPHALLNRALAEHGRREFGSAHASLNKVAEYITSEGDAYLETSIAAFRARVLASEGRFDEALRALRTPAASIPSLPLRAEYVASQALILTRLGASREAADLLEEARATFSHSVEFRVLDACVKAITELETSGSNGALTRDAWRVAAETGNYDGVVCAYRAVPSLLQAFYDIDVAREPLADIVSQARDFDLARKLGLKFSQRQRRPHTALTPRETDVFRLLREGLSNRAIAETLYLSEATVKAHLRHIYAKLGVRTRTEALARSSASDDELWL